MKLVFVRHGESTGNLLSADERATLETPNHAYPLSEDGEKQADIVGDYFAKLGTTFDVCYHSTFARTGETLARILVKTGQQHLLTNQDARLDEKWDGIFHELSRVEIEQSYPEQIRLRNRAGYYHYRAPGGESCPDVELRIRSILSEIEEKYANKHVLLVGHGNWFLLFQKVRHTLSIPAFLELRQRGYKNCAVTTYPDLLQTLPAPVVPWEGRLSENKTSFA